MSTVIENYEKAKAAYQAAADAWSATIEPYVSEIVRRCFPDATELSFVIESVGDGEVRPTELNVEMFNGDETHCGNDPDYDRWTAFENAVREPLEWLLELNRPEGNRYTIEIPEATNA